MTTRLPPILITAALLAGCLQTTQPFPEQEGGALTRPEIQAFYGKAKDPRRFWLTVSDSAAGPVFSGGYRTHPNQYCVLPFGSPKGSAVPVIELRTRGADVYRGLVDTSSSEVWASVQVAAFMGLSPLNNPPFRLYPVHVDDDIPGLLCAGDKFRLDQVHLETPLVFARAAHGSLGPLRRGQENIQVVLGTRFLQVFRTIQFDFANRELLLTTVSPYTPTPDNLVATIPYSLRPGALSVSGTLDGRPTSFLLDTAGEFGLVLGTPSAEPLHQVALGGLVFPDLVATPAADHGLGMPDTPRIGLELLSRYRITLDGQKQVIHFETPEA